MHVYAFREDQSYTHIGHTHNTCCSFTTTACVGPCAHPHVHLSHALARCLPVNLALALALTLYIFV